MRRLDDWRQWNDCRGSKRNNEEVAGWMDCWSIQEHKWGDGKQSRMPRPWSSLSKTTFPQPSGCDSQVRPLLHSMKPMMMMRRWGGGYAMDIVAEQFSSSGFGCWCACCVLCVMCVSAQNRLSQQPMGPRGSYPHGRTAHDEENLFAEQLDL
jgi:hypothetical protein